MEEIWKPVPGFEKYEINRQGDIKRFGKIRKPQRDMLYTKSINLRKDNKTYWRSINKLVRLAFQIPKNKKKIDPFQQLANGIAQIRNKFPEYEFNFKISLRP